MIVVKIAMSGPIRSSSRHQLQEFRVVFKLELSINIIIAEVYYSCINFTIFLLYLPALQSRDYRVTIVARPNACNCMLTYHV